MVGAVGGGNFVVAGASADEVLASRVRVPGGVQPLSMKALKVRDSADDPSAPCAPLAEPSRERAGQSSQAGTAPPTPAARAPAAAQTGSCLTSSPVAPSREQAGLVCHRNCLPRQGRCSSTLGIVFDYSRHCSLLAFFLLSMLKRTDRERLVRTDTRCTTLYRTVMPNYRCNRWRSDVRTHIAAVTSHGRQ